MKTKAKTTETKTVWLTRVGHSVEKAVVVEDGATHLTVRIVWPREAKRAISVAMHAVHLNEAAAWDRVAERCEDRAIEARAQAEEYRVRAMQVRHLMANG